MSYSSLADAATDDAVLRELADLYGERVVRLPPVALVIAAYNEEGAVGPVVVFLSAIGDAASRQHQRPAHNQCRINDNPPHWPILSRPG